MAPRTALRARGRTPRLKMPTSCPTDFWSGWRSFSGRRGRHAWPTRFESPKEQAFWVNPLRSGFTLPVGEPLPWDERLQRYTGTGRLSEHAAVVAGAAYPVNPASALAARTLAVAPGMEVLDLAAAPGGKTIMLAGLMENQGRLAAVEVIKPRFHRMLANLERCGVTNVVPYLADGRAVGRKVPERFDRILLDAPCSSEARFRAGDPDTFAHWSERKLRETSRKQRGLLRSAFAALKPGGELLYCTCAFAPEENEAVVDQLLKAEAKAEVLPVDPPPTGIPGLTAWRGKRFDERCAGAVRVLPDQLWDGFFLCRIGKHA